MREQTVKQIVLATVGMVALTAAAYAQAPAQPAQQTPGAARTQMAPTTVSTQDFVNTVANINMFEIQAAKTAQSQTKDDDIKNFAQLMIDDHNKMADGLKTQTENMQNVQIPSDMTKDFQDRLQTLKSAKGHQFDQAYRRQMVQSHKEAINFFQDYARVGDNDALKTWAKDQVAMLEKHLNRAEALPKTTAGL